MRLPKRIVYVPGMISLVMLPLLINVHIRQYVTNYKQHVIQVTAYKVNCNEYEETLGCAIGTNLMIYGPSAGPIPPDTPADMLNLSLPQPSVRHGYLNEFFTLRYAKDTLFITGICYIILVCFAVHRHISYRPQL